MLNSSINSTNRTAALFQRLASVRLGVTIIMVLAIDLALGYFFVDGHTVIFEPLNQVGLWSWIATYGRINLVYSAWFFVFLILMVVLVMNTLCCTLLRLHRLWQHRHQGIRRFGFALSTHIMHLGMVIILAGYLASYSLTTVYPSITLTPEKQVNLNGTSLNLSLQEMDLPYYRGDRLPATFIDRVITPTITVVASQGDHKRLLTLGLNKPAFFSGYSFFLQRFSPKSKSGMTKARYIVLDIRRDPGVLLYFIGIAVFVVGMIGYIWFWQSSRRVSQSSYREINP